MTEPPELMLLDWQPFSGAGHLPTIIIPLAQFLQ